MRKRDLDAQAGVVFPGVPAYVLFMSYFRIRLGGRVRRVVTSRKTREGPNENEKPRQRFRILDLGRGTNNDVRGTRGTNRDGRRGDARRPDARAQA